MSWLTNVLCCTDSNILLFYTMPICPTSRVSWHSCNAFFNRFIHTIVHTGKTYNFKWCILHYLAAKNSSINRAVIFLLKIWVKKRKIKNYAKVWISYVINLIILTNTTLRINKRMSIFKVGWFQAPWTF